MKKIRVLVTDDHSIVREGLKQFLNSQPDMEVIGEAGDGAEALEKVRALHPDVVLLDISMPNMTGCEVAHLIRDASPESRIVVFPCMPRKAWSRKSWPRGRWAMF
jgi:DNA-binding NarL/FixJ family response regulator